MRINVSSRSLDSFVPTTPNGNACFQPSQLTRFRSVLTRMLSLSGTDGVPEKWIGTTTDIHDLWTAKLLLKETNEALETTLSRVRQLERLLSICSFCKKIRDENDQWQHLETHISTRSDTRFSHGVCQGCGREHYGDLWRQSAN